MEKLVEDGKVRYLGVSNFSVAQMTEAEEALSKNSISSNQVEYSLKARRIEDTLLPYCKQEGIAILAYRPLAHGTLAAPNLKLRRVMEDISKKHSGKTPAQIALNWLLTKDEAIFPIPRSSTPERVIEDSGSTGWNLDMEDIRKLEDAVLAKTSTFRAR